MLVCLYHLINVFVFYIIFLFGVGGKGDGGEHDKCSFLNAKTQFNHKSGWTSDWPIKNALTTYCLLVWLKTGKKNPSKNECTDATSF